MKSLRAATAALTGFALASNAWYLARQEAPPSWDDAWYLETSFRLFSAFKRGLPAFAAAYIDAFRFKAPLLSLTPLPLYAAFGMSERLGVWVNMLFLPATWFCIYALGRRLFTERAALFAVWACALMPLTYGLSRLFYVECLLTALIAAAHWAIVAARPGRTQDGLRLGALLGLGLLAKSLFPLYVAAALWQRRCELRTLARPTLWLGGAIAASWYAFNAPYVLGYMWAAGFGRIARDYTIGLGVYAATLARGVLSWPIAAASALILAAAARQTTGGAGRWSPGARLVAGWLLLPLAVCAVGVNKDVRFIAPALPALALAVGAAADRLARGRGWRAALAACATVTLAVFCSQTFGVPTATALAYNGPPSRDPGWDRAAVIAAVDRSATERSVIAVAFEHRWLNANNLSSLAASLGRDYRFVNLGYAQASVQDALIHIEDKGADHLLLVCAPATPDLPAFLNRANEGVEQAVERGSLPARRVCETALAPGVTATLFKLARR